jgi:heme exporter protein A
MTAALELQGVECVRGGRPLFTGLQTRVPAGHLLRVQGPNGAGKTSLLRMICGLLAPAQGQVLWQGLKISDLQEEFNRQLVYLGHAAALKDDLSAIENLQTSGVLGGVTPTEREAAAALAQAGLRGRELAPARTLSQGQRKRVALARLVLSPHALLWVLDEPFNALDTAATAWLLGLVTTHLQRGGVVVLTSHQSVALAESVPQVMLDL